MTARSPAASPLYIPDHPLWRVPLPLALAHAAEYRRPRTWPLWLVAAALVLLCLAVMA